MDTAKKTKKLHKEVKNWSADWVLKAQMRKLHFKESHDALQAFLGDKPDDIDVSTAFQSLSTWHLVHFHDAVLSKGQDGLSDLMLSTHYGALQVGAESGLILHRTGQFMILLPQAALIMAQQVICGWPKLASFVFAKLHGGLDTKLLDLRHTDRHEKGVLYRHFWFILQLYAKVQGVRIDLSQYSYPESMQPYAPVLANWQTTDLALVQKYVTAMADFHISQADFVHEDVNEFDNNYRSIYPYEILFWLKLRQNAGLQNPETFEHPLMQLPTARLLLDALPMPDLEVGILKEVLQKFEERNPGAFKA